ncbi:15139_t:CDS:1 [Cetraspora pellucida]|uniref:15139_t:CDS:1 n=1 Tax=Cetraspora pellucida TaxID=1433469 RepID=A0A9N9DYT7_9GLOM|nr:15139_t:CDS:1 [Cetraspora pellucida]
MNYDHEVDNENPSCSVDSPDNDQETWNLEPRNLYDPSCSLDSASERKTYVFKGSSFDSFNTDPQASLDEIMKNPPYELTLQQEELLAPRKQKKKTRKAPRAQNKFILFRKDYTARVRRKEPRRAKSMKTQEFSKEASEKWEEQSTEVKRFFTILAEVATERHKMMYPEYKYEPEKKKDKQVAFNDEFEEFIDYSQCENP